MSKLSLRRLRLRRGFLWFLTANERQAALQLCREVGACSGDMYRLARLFTKPSVQLIGSGSNEAALAAKRHSFRCPALHYGSRLAEECSDLLPALERGRWLSLRLLAGLPLVCHGICVCYHERAGGRSSLLRY
jgi:hypothetical protein